MRWCLVMLVTISDGYTSQLKAKDHRVLDAHIDDRIAKRPHVGILIEKSNFSYFIPLSSADYSDYKNGNVRHSTLTIKRIFSKNKFIGKLLLNNMIPVPKSEIEVISLVKTSDKEYNKYIDLLSKEIICIRGMLDEVKKSATILYNEKLNEKNDSFWKSKKKGKYLDATLDFSLLEEVCAEWTRLKTIEKIRNKEELPNDWEFYGENDGKLYRVMGQDTSNPRYIAAILKSDFDAKKYENLNLYEVENNKINFRKSLSEDINCEGIGNLANIIKSNVQELEHQKNMFVEH